MVDRNELDRVLGNCDYIRKYCVNLCDEKNENLYKECGKLMEAASQVYGIANEFFLRKYPELNYPPVNGYVMFLRALTSFTDLFVNQIKSKRQVDSELMQIFPVITIYKEWLFEVHAALEDKSSSEGILMQSKVLNGCRPLHKLIHLADSALYPLCVKYALFWAGNKTRTIMKNAIWILAFFKSLPSTLPCLWSNDSTAFHMVSSIRNMDLDHPFDEFHRIPEHWISSTLCSIFYWKTGVNISKFQVTRQTRYILDCNGNILDFERMTKQEIDAFMNDGAQQEILKHPGRRHRNFETVGCSYLKSTSTKKVMESLQRLKNKRENPPNFAASKHHTVRRVVKAKDKKPVSPDNLNPENALIINIHGGGLFMFGTSSFECYLRSLMSDLVGVPMLSIDYSLTVPYPICNQDVLDVYLWAVSGSDEVKEKFGFIPKKIVLCGDSAGGFLALSLLLMLNDINKTIKNGPKILMPESMIMLYTLYSFSHLTPSKTRVSLDTLINVQSLSLVYSLYGANLSTIRDFKEIENTERFKRVVQKNQNLCNNNIEEKEIKSEKDEKIDLNSPWFNVDYATYKNYADYIESFYNHPYLQPKLYRNRYEELKDIDLWVIVGSSDILLDDNIDLANDWKGNVSMDIVHNQEHGFLVINFDEDFGNALQLTITRFQEACGLL